MTAVSHVTVPGGALAGLRAAGPAPPAALLRLAIELQPRENLDALAAQIADPAHAQHRAILTSEAFDARFGRGPDGEALGKRLRADGASNVATAHNGLVISAIVDIALAEKLFATHYVRYTNGTRVVFAPNTPLTIPAPAVRDVRGAVVATTPRLNDVRTPYTGFRGDWYLPDHFRQMYDALPDGGAGQRIALVEDASDVFDLKDLGAFVTGAGAPHGANAARVSEIRSAFKTNAQDCGRDDRGQETALDVDAAMTMAPLASILVGYDDVCSAGNDGTGALAHALDQNPTIVVFPFAVGPVRASGVAATYGAIPLPYLEAIVRGIPIVVSAGDDGAYGYRESGIDEAAVSWPCVLPVVICAGGTQLGDRESFADEGPWNDAAFAGAGGVSTEPRPPWQTAPSTFELSPDFVKQRIAPDVSADASGHLRIYWHGYGLGGVGGTSESASLVAGQLAAINAAVPANARLSTAGDLYVLAKSHPDAFRDVKAENDRRYLDNTLRPPPPKLAKNFAASCRRHSPTCRAVLRFSPTAVRSRRASMR